jgi:hypothetical protein
MVQKAHAGAAHPGAAASCSGNDSAADTSRPAQIFNIDGERLPDRRPRLICGAPRRARPSSYRLAADKWQEVAR